jgi:hypothetical protein
MAGIISAYAQKKNKAGASDLQHPRAKNKSNKSIFQFLSQKFESISLNCFCFHFIAPGGKYQSNLVYAFCFVALGDSTISSAMKTKQPLNILKI